MAQHLRSLTVLIYGELWFSFRIVAHNQPVAPIPGDRMLSTDLSQHQELMWNAYIHAGETHTK